MEYTAYIQKVRQLLSERSVILHKAGSMRRILDDTAKDKARVIYEAQAHLLTENLIDTVAAQFPDQRPEPMPEIFYNGKRMVIQKYDGLNCTYVAEENFNADQYVYKRSNYRDHIISELNRH